MPNAIIRRPRPILLFMILLACSLALSGCFGGSNTNSRSSAEPQASAATGNAPARTFGIIYPMTHPFYETITRSAEEAAAEKGFRLIVKAPDEANQEQQIRMMETMIQQNVDGIAIDPVNGDALAPVIDKAVNSGIPVICFESDAPSSKRLAYIGTNNTLAGAKMGEALDKLLDGKGMILAETGMSRMKSLNDRLEGMLTYLNEHTDIQVLEVRYNEGSEDRALLNIEEMIDAHPHFDAFVGLDFVSGSASVLVWKAMGLTRYALTFGLTPEIREAIDNGQITTAMSQNEELWGGRIVARLAEAAEGKPLPLLDETGVAEVTR
ncbi:sugar ABC transporter substrate-binding protein [Cohnella suwonensis]|uniref:Sugar ABC transporter substrate-binding protein n=1 Tax=Cohnella suwonensis TaxID=696072 RepID=A0ABW0LUS1_9BACL